MPEIIPQKRLDPALHGFKLEDCKQIPELKIKILKLLEFLLQKKHEFCND